MSELLDLPGISTRGRYKFVTACTVFSVYPKLVEFLQLTVAITGINPQPST